MSQSPREVVQRAVHFEGPDRLPLRFATLGISDTHSVSTAAIGTGDHALRETYDEWHCLWTRSEMANMGQVKGHPLEDWSAIARYVWPDPDDPAYYANMAGQFEGSEDKYIMTSIFMLLFERMHSLRGMTNVLTELYADRVRMEFLADRIVDFDLAVIRNIGERFPARSTDFPLPTTGAPSWRRSSARPCGAISSSPAMRSSLTPATPRAGTYGCIPVAR